MKMIQALLPLAALAATQQVLVDQTPLTSQLAEPRPFILDAIPLLGYGTWRLTSNTSEHVSYAIQQGYTHIDCAAAYGNEAEVGKGIKDGLEKSGKSREDLWITSKLWNDHHDVRRVEEAIDESLSNLGLEYLNLYLMHWPVAQNNPGGVNTIDYLDAWQEMGKLVDSGRTHHIGVANFDQHQMQDLLDHPGGHPPQVHQMELHPYLQQSEFVKWHQEQGIHVTAYSPLAGTNPIYDPGSPTPLLENEVVKKIAEKRDCTPAQVAIMWAMSRGTSVIPKSSNNTRITENFYSLECILHGSDLEKLEELGKEHYRFNNPAKSWGVPLYEGLEDSEGKHESDR